MTDVELLQRYARKRSEAAFEELVRRRINLIYSAALRQVNNDAHLAEDVTQAVFTDLARKAAQLTQHPSLTAWLYTSTRFIAANIRRTEQRRAAREEEAHAMNATYSMPETEPDWAQIRPLLDDAMHALGDQDREIVLLRHFEQRSYAEIGSRFGLTEDAARMKANRALEKLHDKLRKRGVTSTALALAGLMASNAVGAAPTHLAAKTASAAMAAGADCLPGLLTSKIQLAIAVVVLAVGVTVVVFSRHDSAATSGKMSDVAVANAPAIAPPVNPPAVSRSAVPLADEAVLHLQIITADSGKSIPSVPILYSAWHQDRVERQLWSDRFGVCDMVYPTNIYQLQLTTGKGPFADAQLVWRRPLGDVIPSNYVLRLERAVPIGGSVVDPDGNPVAGATVVWNLNCQDFATPKSPDGHEYYGDKFETMTDQNGRWQLNRMADEIMPWLIGEAKESNYVDSGLVSTSHDKSVEQRLRGNAYVFKLGRGATAEGVVVDTNGTPIPGAEILVDVSHRSGQSRNDGKFSVGGCLPEKQPITVKAPGFPALTAEVHLGENAKPIRLVLRRGKFLRLRIEDKGGNPIPRSNITSIHSKTNQAGQVSWLILPNLEMGLTDQDGRATWTNAPDDELEFNVSAWGFGWLNSGKIRPDGQEHMITLSPTSP